METRRAEAIAQTIEEDILSNRYVDGERLDEAMLAARFRVSRTPIREAMQRLAISGVVVLRPRRGAFVRQPTTVDLMEMFEVMAEYEAFCARLAAGAITEEALAEMSEVNAECARAVEAQDADRYYEANEQFHHMLYAQSGNSFLETEALRLHRRLRPYRRLQLRLRGRMAQSMAEHDAILSALEEGDADGAASAIREHVGVQGEKFRRLVAALPATPA